MKSKGRLSKSQIWWALTLLFLANLLVTGSLAVSNSQARQDPLAYFVEAKSIYEGKGLVTGVKTPYHPDTSPPYGIEENLNLLSIDLGPKANQPWGEGR